MNDPLMDTRITRTLPRRAKNDADPAAASSTLDGSGSHLAPAPTRRTEDLQDLPVHALPASEVLNCLEVDPLTGLDDSEVLRRRAVHGRNELAVAHGPGALRLLLSQCRTPVVYLLTAAAVFSAVLGDHVEAIAIVIVLAINAVIGFVTEWRARRSMDALRDLSVRHVNMRRNGYVVTLPANELVPGDIVLIEAGNMLSADMRIIDAAGLASDESALTGESLPVLKAIDPTAEDEMLADRRSMLFKGCAISSGTGEAVVTATGMHSELGRITGLVASSEASRSPLEDQLASLSRDLMLFTLIVTAVVGIAGVLGGRDLALMVKSAVALAVATIPEGLPIVATLALARGMRRMAKHNALIEHLSAVETLGATTIIMTDKTGTLTENRMELARIVTMNDDIDLRDVPLELKGESVVEAQSKSASTLSSTIHSSALDALLRSCVLCNNATVSHGENPASGDPMEVALLEAAAAMGHERGSTLEEHPEVREVAFDSTTRLMATVHRTTKHDAPAFLIAVKGAPEAVFESAQSVMFDSAPVPFDASQQRFWTQKSDELAKDGLRVLAIASKLGDSDQDVYEQLTLLGLVGFRDPPRSDIAETIAITRRAGIDVVMITGDHAETARHIARDIGLVDSDAAVIDGKQLATMGSESDKELSSIRALRVFARVSPEQKLNLITLHQDAGEVVGMIGDGINDAPALKKADIGVAMGTRGTQVAKDAADIILQDDAFSTLVHAIREGRIIFTNIRRFSVYLLSCNLSEILVVGFAVLAGLPLPLLPLQILFLNLVTDVFPAFALGTIAAGRDVLERPPLAPSESILGPRQWRTVAANGIGISIATLLAMAVALQLLHLQAKEVSTLCFYTLALAQLWLVLAMHNWRENLFQGKLIVNRYIWSAVAFCLLLLLGAAQIPTVSSALQFETLSPESWAWILGLSLLPLAFRELSTMVLRFSREAKPIRH